MTRFISLLLVFWLCALPALAQSPRPLGQALDAMRSGNWQNAERLAERDGPVAADVLLWHKLRAGRGSFEELTGFLQRRPNWPGLGFLKRRAEPIVLDQSQAQLLTHFDAHPPQTPEAILAYAQALQSAERDADARTAVVAAWREAQMEAGLEAAYLDEFADILEPHHIARLDRALWRGWRAQAQRMIAHVPEDWQRLAQARLALQRGREGVTDLIAEVPEALQGTAGLALDRFNWRRANRTDTAIDLMLERSISAEALGEPAAWAGQRRVLARAQMRAGNDRRAYELAANHHLTSGAAYADLEWLAGYLSLRKLGDPETALAHFRRFDAAVRSPISKGRAGYWMGRAFAAMGDAEAAQRAYAKGAQHQTSFYGLLAAEAAGLDFDPTLDGAETAPDWRQASFADDDLFQAGTLLLVSGERNLAERFLTHLAEDLDAQELAQLGQMAIDRDEPHLAVMIGKRAARRGIVVPAPYYALHPLAQMDLGMAPEMLLAIARRESEFDPVVVSGAGAQGLMQVMPATAREVAGDLGLLGEHSEARLLRDPDYNARLGAAYLVELAGRFGGNVVMMSAAYNAGPSRPLRWMELYGDPRSQSTPEFDMIDWIEHIPFRETRNYVMRVTESLPIYRARLGKDPLPVPFTQELSGATLRAFAPETE